MQVPTDPDMVALLQFATLSSHRLLVSRYETVT